MVNITLDAGDNWPKKLQYIDVTENKETLEDFISMYIGFREEWSQDFNQLVSCMFSHLLTLSHEVRCSDYTSYGKDGQKTHYFHDIRIYEIEGRGLTKKVIDKLGRIKIEYWE